MGHTHSKTLCLISLSTIIGLGGCVSNKGVLKLSEQDKQWFCVPQDTKGWLCTKDNSTFNKLASAKHINVESQWTVGDKVQQENIVIETDSEVSDQSEALDRSPTEEPNSYKAPVLNNNSVSQNTAESSLASPSDSVVIQESINDKHSTEPPFLSISPWIVQLAAYSTKDAAERFVQSLGEGQVFNTYVNGKNYFTVALVGYASQLEAEKAVAELEKRQLGVSPWVRTGASFEKNLATNPD